ncbi:MAG: transcription initiation factor IIB [Nitrososphaera sp.]
MEDDVFSKCKLVTCIKGPVVTDNNTGEVLCGSCGQVLVEKINSMGLDARSFDLEQFNEKSRTGAKSSLAIHDKGLATTIGVSDKDASGNYLSGYMKNTFHRLRIWDKRSKSEGNDRNLRRAFTLLDMIKSQLVLPDNVVEEAAYIYRKAIAKKLTRGRGIDPILCASIYASCRKNNTPRTLRDIAKAGNLSRGDLACAFRIMIKSLDLKIDPYDPVEFVTRICSEIDASEKTRRVALNLVSRAEENGFATGKNPMSLVAAAIYVACCITREDKTQIEIAKACGVSNVAVRNLALFFKKVGRDLK